MTDKNIDLTEKVNITDKVEIEQNPAATSGSQYRYLDEACSGIAYYAESEITEHKQGFCNNCGATLSSFRAQNLIPLTENEKEQLAALEK